MGMHLRLLAAALAFKTAAVVVDLGGALDEKIKDTADHICPGTNTTIPGAVENACRRRRAERHRGPCPTGEEHVPSRRRTDLPASRGSSIVTAPPSAPICSRLAKAGKRKAGLPRGVNF